MRICFNRLLSNSRNNQLFYLLALVFFGLWSMLLGQDRSFDLAGYHLYNGFSFLHKKLEIDFAPAGVQSYLNPLLDFIFYYLNSNLKPSFFGFLMGFIHGFNFLLISQIVEILLRPYKVDAKERILIVLTSVLSCNFLAGLGNSSGDNTLSILILTSIFILLKNIESNKSHLEYKPIFFSGFLIGIATALKLTNGIYAPAFIVAMLSMNLLFKRKLLLSFFFGFSVILGFLIFGGGWHLKIWSMFHNPIFPYFSNLFKNNFSAYTNPTSSWLPKNVWELIFWPFIFSLNYHRVGEGSFHQILWPFFYTLVFITLIRSILVNFSKGKKKIILKPSERFILIFSLSAYILWVKFFCVIRYIVSIELLLPVIIFILLKSLTSKISFSNHIKNFCFSSIFITLLGGYSTWGHTKWTDIPFNVEMPKESFSKNTLVIFAGGAPISWMGTQFPETISFVKLGIFNIEEFLRRKNNLENYEIYTMFGGYYNWREDNVKKWNGYLDNVGLLSSRTKCMHLQNFIQQIKFRGKIVMISENSCYLSLKDSDSLDSNYANLAFISDAEKDISKHGFHIQNQSCSLHNAYLGSQKWKFIWCKTLYKPLSLDPRS